MTRPKSYIIDNKKLCLLCNNEIEVDQFNINKRSSDGLQPYCKPCQAKKKAQWYIENKDKAIDYRIKYAQEHSEYNKDKYRANPEYHRDKYNL